MSKKTTRKINIKYDESDSWPHVLEKVLEQLSEQYGYTIDMFDVMALPYWKWQEVLLGKDERNGLGPLMTQAVYQQLGARGIANGWRQNWAKVSAELADTFKDIKGERFVNEDND